MNKELDAWVSRRPQLEASLKGLDNLAWRRGSAGPGGSPGNFTKSKIFNFSFSIIFCVFELTRRLSSTLNLDPYFSSGTADKDTVVWCAWLNRQPEANLDFVFVESTPFSLIQSLSLPGPSLPSRLCRIRTVVCLITDRS